MTLRYPEEELAQKLKNNPDINVPFSMLPQSIKKPSKVEIGSKCQPKENKPFIIGEREFLSQVIWLAHAFSWKCAHFRPARVLKNGMETWRTAVSADGAGFPDLIMIRPPRLVFAELKSEKGKTTLEQDAWLKNLKSCHIFVDLDGKNNAIFLPEVYLWRPKDMEPNGGQILEILR